MRKLFRFQLHMSFFQHTAHESMRRLTAEWPSKTQFVFIVSYTPAAKFCKLENKKMECGLEAMGMARDLSRKHKKVHKSGTPAAGHFWGSPILSTCYIP